MANRLYGQGSASLYGVKGAYSSLYTSATDRSVGEEPYVPASSTSDPTAGGFSAFSASRYAASASWAAGVGASAVDYTGTKRPSEAFYEQSILGAHYMIGQTEDWLSTNILAKRPRFETSSILPVYPQRPGEKDCTFYMLTRTCKFGESCKFDHPIWVPEGGIPDWNEVPQVSSDTYPERPGEPDCPHFLKTQNCKFGINCKFNHPKDKLVSVVTSGSVGSSVFPERPTEPPCAFYMKTGFCKFGVNCKFHHPKDIRLPSDEHEAGNGEQVELIKPEEAVGDVINQPRTSAPALGYNTKGLPIRVGEVDCPFYMKTGSCKYGAACRYSHPDHDAINAPAALIGPSALTSPSLVSPASSLFQSFDARLSQTMLGLAPTTVYPQRPGEIECDHYMKTGECKFGLRCRFHHPIDRSSHQNVKLTLAGLPRREGAPHCAFYMKNGTCKFAITCKFDHPPPGEVMATAATTQETSGSTEGGSAEEDDNGAETAQEQ